MVEEVSRLKPPHPSILTLMSWNYRGVCNQEMRQALRALIRVHQPHCVFLVETKRSETRMRRLGQLLGFSNCVAVGARGLVMLWNKEVRLECLWTSERMICCSMKTEDNSPNWTLVGVYGTPYRRD